MQKKKLFASAMLLLATLLWGLSYSIQTISAADIGTFTIVFFKGIGGILIFPLIMMRGEKITKDTLKGGIIIGCFAFLGCALQQMGIENSTVSKASFITVLYIIFVPLIESFTGKKIPAKIFISIGIALVGLYFLCMSGSFDLCIGDLYLLLCSICFALQIFFIDRFSQGNDALPLTFVAQLTVSFLSLIVALFKEPLDVNALKNALLPILFITLLGGLLAQCLQFIFQKDVGSTLASLLMSFESVFGALFGWLILNQTLNAREIFGCFLVFVAILIAESA
ncbi:MAG: DMT family transporter [Erysipelotrichaceae bacterium]|nr:DMT family transporter [Erysipelotrichaceae bacterium]